MDNFWKLFTTLFGIGAAVSFAKSLRSKKRWQEVISEIIITGLLACGAGVVYLFYPAAPFVAVAGVAAILAILGVNFLSDKIEGILDKSVDKILGNKNGS